MMFPLLAEAAATVDYTAIAAGGSTLLNTGATLWFFYYTNTVTIPNMQKDHRLEREEIQKRNDIDREQVRAEFLSRIQEVFRDARSEREGILNEMKLARETFERARNDHKG